MTTEAKSKANRADPNEIERGMRMVTVPDQVVELRALNVENGRWKNTYSGYYDDLSAFARAAAELSGRASGVYFTLNPCKPALLARAHNRFRCVGRGDPTTADHDIERRCWLPVDFDPVRPSGISATDEEHEAALGLAREVMCALVADGWPQPVFLDSGNGAHLLARVDLPASDDGLVERVLKGLAQRFDRDDVKIDSGNHNPARIWKVPGTLARKGDSTPERPHRDKIAASKKKGMWMGGNPPLGYDCKDRNLVVDEVEAKTVRHIFRRYLEVGSVRLLKDQLDAEGVVSKVRKASDGITYGGKPLARGALYLMLQNRIYRGEIVHKDKSYPGLHEAIVDQTPWDEVQAVLAQNRVAREAGIDAKQPGLLAGLLHDAQGQPMTPTHAIKKGKRYRYYVSRPLIAERAAATCGQRLPAASLEPLVVERIRGPAGGSRGRA